MPINENAMPSLPVPSSKFQAFFDIKANVGRKLNVILLNTRIVGEYQSGY